MPQDAPPNGRESPLRRQAHGGFGERPGETVQGQPRNRAPGLLSHAHPCHRLTIEATVRL
jgi:hypothetical protein